MLKQDRGMSHTPLTANKPIIHVLFFSLFILSLYGCEKTWQKKLRDGKDIIVRDKSFSSELDLTNLVKTYQFSPNRKHAVITSNLIFINCTFNGFTTFKRDENFMFTLEFSKNLIFNKCTFNNTADLSYLTINGDFSALECQFIGPVIMSNAWFKGKSSSFTSVHFYNKVKAVNCLFDNNTSFFKARFYESISFQNSIFKGKTNFGGANFNKYAGFDKTTFLCATNFSKSTFYGKAIFNYASFIMASSFFECDFGDAPTFKNTDFNGITDFANAKLPHTYQFKENKKGIYVPVEVK